MNALKGSSAGGDRLAFDESSGSYMDPLRTVPMKTYYVMYFLFGNAALLAFNIIINAIDIYLALTGEKDVAVMLTRCYNIPSSCIALILCFWKPKNLRKYMMMALAATGIFLCCLPIFILIPMDGAVVYWGSMIIVGLCGIAGSSILSTTYATAAQFSAEHAAFASSGSGCCGVVASVLRIITKAIFAHPTDQQNKFMSTIYFFLAAIFIFATLGYYMYILRVDGWFANNINPVQTESKLSQLFNGVKDVIETIWPIWLANFINFMNTLSVFPGYVTGLPEKEPWGTWTSVIVTSLFCVFDWVGRYIPSQVMWPSQKWCYIPAYVRLLFYVIFMVSIQGVLDLGEPYWTFLWMIPFAVSNGWMSTLLMVHGSNHTDLSPDQKRTAGFIMSFATTGGILAAMFVTYALPASAIA